MNKTLNRFASVAAATTVAGTGLVVAAAPAQAATSVWDKVATCESSNHWSDNTGNSFYGGLQFTISTWDSFGGQQYADRADHATKAEQITVAQRVLAVQGPHAWPVCSIYAGLTQANGGASSSSSSSASTYSAPAVSVVSSTKAVTKAAVTKAAVTQTAATSESSETAAAVVSTPAKAASTSGDYTVKKGDTLFQIARTHGISSWKSIYSLNKDQIANPDLIYVGQHFALS